MALTISEGTTQETLDRIPKAGFPVGYANIMRVMIDWQGNFSADVRRYFSEDERRENEHQIPGLIGIGAQIPDEIKNQVFGLVYPYLEAQVNINAINEKRQAEIDTIAEDDEARGMIIGGINEKYDAQIEEIKTALGI